MKSDLATSILAAIVGALVAFFACNFFIGPIEPATFTTVEADIGTDLAEPNVNMFNYKALNPTVEVYVGDCGENSASEECQ